METKLSNNVLTIDSREVAEMLEKSHGDLLKDIQGSGKNLGLIPVLTEGKIPVVDFFIEKSRTPVTLAMRGSRGCGKAARGIIWNKIIK